MLRELVIRQFALIEKLELEFADGMTVFTGETGAGKSILVDALGAAFGTRASSDWVRHGADKAEVMASIETRHPQVLALLKEQDIEVEDDLMLRRVINSDGRSKAYVNGTPVPMKILQQIGDACLDLHGQHEHQALLHTAFQKQMLDARLDTPLRQRMGEAHQQWRTATKALQSLESERDDSGQQLDWMRQELARLQTLEIEEGLADALHMQVEAGQHQAHIQEAASMALSLIDDGEVNVRNLLAQAAHAVDRMSEHHPSLQESSQLMAQLDAIIGELTPNLQDAMNSQLDAEALQQAEERLAELRDAMRRHHCDEPGLLSLMQEWDTRISRLDTAEWDAEKLQQQLQDATKTFREVAMQLHEARESAAKKLAGELRPFLDRLGLAGMQIRIDIEAMPEATDQWHPDGWDRIAFMASSNPGEPFRPLAAIASGGEISRFVLALKGCGALEQAPDIAVFDEVDTGIGGETAWCVGELLAGMGQARQVLVVSHLPQVAACADHQIHIHKHVNQDRTHSELEPLNAEARVQEIARMLGGIDSNSLKHAEQMLARGRKRAATA